MVCYVSLSGGRMYSLEFAKMRSKTITISFFFIGDTETDKYFSLTSGNVFFVREQTGGINKNISPLH